MPELTSRRRWWILLTVGLATFLPSTYNSILNTILPEIQLGLHASLAASAWVMLLYLLVLTVLLLPIGRISDLLGRRNLLIGGFALFTAAAVLCALSRALIWVVIGRGVMGVGGAMLISVGPAVITTLMPAHERGRAMGILSLLTYLGMAVGPVLGGALTQWWGWPAVFLFALPTGVAGVLFGFTVIPKSASAATHSPGRVPLDLPGTTVYAIGVITFTLVMNPGILGSHAAYFVTGFVCITGGALWAFIHIERRVTHPLMNLQLFGTHNFTFGIVSTVLNYVTFFLITFLVPVYLSNQLHLSPAIVGMWMSAMSVVMTIVAPIAGAMYDRIGSRELSTAGMLCTALALATFTFVAHKGQGRLLWLSAALLLGGLGTALFAPPNNTSVLMSAPAWQQGMASGVLTTARYFGMMGGITLGSSLFHWLEQLLQRGGGGGYDSAFRGVMWTAVVIALIGAGFSFRMRRAQVNEGIVSLRP